MNSKKIFLALIIIALVAGSVYFWQGSQDETIETPVDEIEVEDTEEVVMEEEESELLVLD